MLSIKMFKPYYVKEEGHYIRVVLAYQYFSLSLDDQIYHFVPLESREIRMNRVTHEIENQQDVFVFQKGKSYNHMKLAELMQIPDFQEHLAYILNPYMMVTDNQQREDEIDQVIFELERMNLIRLIDQSLDEKNYEDFLYYSSKLNEM
ncbi:hypothetical protein J416_00274 [Gracilibacillus halophilus YIM-C55.5]|uniref:IDEAL domain-containing protein n=1 Tax=Gracilibacillus halophilus YIM-C55.5 TaxID=1308866 RepID=N4WZB7_9BACI|nr:IDEAL domain-containing protein [Gracilibacillus halophilus]ENH98376.1 hypothetical protein J416_00274 [Gracilibacillus halophilus YIM-C55.5]